MFCIFRGSAWLDEHSMPPRDSKFIIDHTEVNEAFGGKGYGKQLVMKAVEFARKQEIKIIPLCPFAVRVFAKDPDIQDVKL